MKKYALTYAVDGLHLEKEVLEFGSYREAANHLTTVSAQKVAAALADELWALKNTDRYLAQGEAGRKLLVDNFISMRNSSFMVENN